MGWGWIFSGPTHCSIKKLSSFSYFCVTRKVLKIHATFVVYFTDELIRQVTINCAERGLLLLRYMYMHDNEL